MYRAHLFCIVFKAFYLNAHLHKDIRLLFLSYPAVIFLYKLSISFQNSYRSSQIMRKCRVKTLSFFKRLPKLVIAVIKVLSHILKRAAKLSKLVFAVTAYLKIQIVAKYHVRSRNKRIYRLVKLSVVKYICCYPDTKYRPQRHSH